MGEAGSVYQYLGTRGRVELGVQDYTDASKWKRIGGEADSAYRYIGTTGSLNLGGQDYSDTTKWTKLAGKPGAIYKYMGTTATRDLSTQNYDDEGLWKQVPSPASCRKATTSRLPTRWRSAAGGAERCARRRFRLYPQRHGDRRQPRVNASGDAVCVPRPTASRGLRRRAYGTGSRWR